MAPPLGVRRRAYRCAEGPRCWGSDKLHQGPAAWSGRWAARSPSGVYPVLVRLRHDVRARPVGGGARHGGVDAAAVSHEAAGRFSTASSALPDWPPVVTAPTADSPACRGIDRSPDLRPHRRVGRTPSAAFRSAPQPVHSVDLTPSAGGAASRPAPSDDARSATTADHRGRMRCARRGPSARQARRAGAGSVLD